LGRAATWWRSILGFGGAGAARSIGTATLGRACAARRALTALLGGAGAVGILAALPALLSAFLTLAAAARRIRALSRSATDAGLIILPGARSSLGDDNGRRGFRLESRHVRRQQHQGKGGAR
jgi:hypothetical protein